jgi:predicted transcriptional regulator
MSDQLDLTELTTKIVSSFVGSNSMPSSEVPELISRVYGALAAAVSPSAAREPLNPAVPVRKSVTPDYIICLEDGAKLKMLKRYLRTRFDMTPEEYRRKWGLPADYPMTASSYSKVRSDLAHKIGLGQKPVGETRKSRAIAATSTNGSKTTTARGRKRGRKPNASKTPAG